MNLKKLKELEKEMLSNSKEYLDLTSHKMLNDNVLIYTLTFEEQDDIVTPQSYEDKTSYGIVISIGEGRILESGELIKPDVKEGDFIMFGKYSSNKERTFGEDYHIIRMDDIISRIDK